MLVAIFAILPQFSHVVVGRVLLAVASLAVLASGVPSMAAHAYSQEYLPAREIAWCRKFIAEQPRKDYLVIDANAIFWITHQVSSTPPIQAMRRRDDIVHLMRDHAFSEVYVYQRLNIDPETERMTIRDGDDLGPQWVLETVREERLQTLTICRLSRVKEIKEGNTVLTTPDPGTKVVPKSRAEIEQARRVYLENFLKQLP
jgi:hypothetical protein